MKRILILSCLLGSVAWGQCVVLPPIPTSNLALNTVQHNACNWDVQYNQVPTQLDYMLSGFVGIWGINLKPQTLSHNPPTGVTLYLNQSDSLLHLRTSVGGDTILAGGGGGGSVANFLAPTASWPAWLVPSVASSTTTPTLTVAVPAQPANQFLASPSGGSGPLSPRLIAAVDIPLLTAAQEPAHTGDVTNTAGSLVNTLATVNPNVGTCGDATHVSQATFDAKGRATACIAVAITAGTGNVSNSGTPTSAQVAVWVDATHVQGVGALTKAQQFATTVYTDASASFGANAYNFGAATALTVPVSAAAAPTVMGQIAFDSVTHTYQVGNGTGTSAQAYFLGSPPTAGTCVVIGSAPYQLVSTTCSGGGNVSSSGTPASGQAAEWVSASAIQGVAVTGSGNYVKATSPTLVTPALGTPSAINLANATNLPGASITGSRTVPQGTLPLGTAGAPGILQVDGTSITATGGVISSTGGLTAGPNGTLTITTGVIDTVNGVVGKLTNSETMTGLWKANIGMNFTEVAACNTPGITPGAGIMFLCGDTDHHFYAVDNSGTVTQLGGGSGFTKSWIRATRSTGQVIADNTPTSLVWDTNDAHNTGALFTHSTSSNTERVVAASSTYAHGGCQVSASTGANGNVWKVSVSQVVSGTPIDISQSDTAYSNELQTNISFSTYILAGDYLVCNVYQNTGLTAPLTAVANFVVEN